MTRSPAEVIGVLDIIGVVAFAVVFAFWWAFKPRSSRTPVTGGGVLGDPLLGRSPTARATPPPLTRQREAAAAGHRAAPALVPGIDHQPGFRPDIEGLRAVAVLLVLGYHIGVVRYGHDALGPPHRWFVDGGYIGVDVFFVVSGFLITSLLLREREARGQIVLPNFWSRRFRRLLAASCLVVVATLVASRSMLEPLRLGNLGRESLAASLFVVNFVFGHRGAGYLQSSEAQSPLQHFWSLAVEEQFYFVWPLVLFVVGAWSRRPRRAMGITVAVLGAASFASCVVFTNRGITHAALQAHAYYYPWNRVWELLVGAGLAVAGTGVMRIPPGARAALAWAGLGGIVVAAVAFSDRTRFPGSVAALPVLSTAAVIVGAVGVQGGPGPLLSIGPMQWIGKHSYAIYLWHWPAIVLAEAKWGPLSVPQLTGVVGVAIVLSAISFRLVEDPVRRSRFLAAPPARGLRLGGALVAVGVLAATLSIMSPPKLTGGGVADAPDALPTTTTAAPSGTDDAPVGSDPAPTASTAVPPIGNLADLESAAASALEEAAQTKLVPDNLQPSLGKASGDLPSIYDDGCLLPESGSITSGECVYGDPSSDTTVVLAGDSHAAQWFPAVAMAATRRGWRLVVLAKQGCPAAEFTTYGAGNRERTGCKPWRQKVAERLAQEHPDLLIVTSYRYRLVTRTDPADAPLWRDALDETLAAWRPLAGHMLVLSDTPNPTDNIPRCLSAHVRSVTKCVRARVEADRADLLASERQAAQANDATLAVTSDWLCGPTTCPVIRGNLLLYRDDNHITATASEFLTPFIEAAAAPLLDG